MILRWRQTKTIKSLNIIFLIDNTVTGRAVTYSPGRPGAPGGPGGPGGPGSVVTPLAPYWPEAEIRT